jgi:hypothetical protein
MNPGCRATTFTNVPEPVYTLMNFCGVRVWFHQYANGSGWAFCFNPGVWGPDSYDNKPGNIQITSNPNPCP